MQGSNLSLVFFIFCCHDFPRTALLRQCLDIIHHRASTLSCVKSRIYTYVYNVHPPGYRLPLVMFCSMKPHQTRQFLQKETNLADMLRLDRFYSSTEVCDLAGVLPMDSRLDFLQDQYVHGATDHNRKSSLSILRTSATTHRSKLKQEFKCLPASSRKKASHLMPELKDTLTTHH